MKKLTLLAAVGVGYVLGTRAGRGRYEQIKQQAEKVWSNESVQSTVHKAQDTAKTTGSDVGHRVAETAKDVTGTVAEKAKDVTGSVTEKVKTATGSSKDDTSGAAGSASASSSVPAAEAPGYATGSQGLRAGATAAESQAPFDIDDAGSDDLSGAAAPNPLSNGNKDSRA